MSKARLQLWKQQFMVHHRRQKARSQFSPEVTQPVVVVLEENGVTEVVLLEVVLEDVLQAFRMVKRAVLVEVNVTADLIASEPYAKKRKVMR